MLRVLRSIWIWAAGASLLLLWVPILGIVRVFDRDPMRLRTGRWFRRLGRNLARLNPCRLHISGREHIVPGRVYVVVSNHQSMGDIPLICFLWLDAKWLAKIELFRFPVTGALLRMAGDIPVDRSDRRKSAKAFLQAVRCVREGCSVVFFPEGTRSPDGEVGPFNDGPFQLALREQVPVLPLVLEGSGAALPLNSWLFGGAHDIYLRVLEPVEIEGWNAKQSAVLRDAVRQRMIDELHRLRSAAPG
jgi:1-acyl-sn-glycerol-3-phosphate acyltransferase